MSLHDHAAERSILSAIVLEPSAFPLVSHLLGASDFHHPAHGLVYGSMARVAATGAPIEIVALRADMTRAGSWLHAGGDAFVLGLMDTLPYTEHLESHAKIVHACSRRRTLIEVCRRIELSGADVSVDTDAFLTEAESTLYTALGTSTKSDAYVTMPDAVQRTRVQNAHAAAERGAIVGIATGIPSLDHELRGMRKGELVVIGGPTSDGKSVLAVTIARNNAVAGKRSAYFSLEMPHEDMVQRLVSMEGVSVAQQESYAFATTEATGKRLRDAYNVVEKLPIEIVYKPGITVAQIRTYCRRLMVDGPLDLVVVDYMALLGSSEKSENRNREVASFSAELLALAGELRVSVIAIQSLSRKHDEAGSRRRPQISHLMDSSSIEYDAHKILLIWDPNAKADGNRDHDTGERELIIGKNRRGRRARAFRVQILQDRFLLVDTETHRSDDDRDSF